MLVGYAGCRVQATGCGNWCMHARLTPHCTETKYCTEPTLGKGMGVEGVRKAMQGGKEVDLCRHPPLAVNAIHGSVRESTRHQPLTGA